MDRLLIYLLQVTAGSVLLYLCFILFYRKDTFYKRNRVLLLLILILPLIFPFLSFGTSVPSESYSQIIIFADKISRTGSGLESTIITGFETMSVTVIILGAWLTGTTVLIARMVISVVRIKKIIGKGKQAGIDNSVIVISGQTPSPFSFWRHIVIPGSLVTDQGLKDIIRHEETHVNQMHTIDVLLSELFIAFFWFNPVSWLIKRSIILNHEFLADNKAIKFSSGPKEYQYRLVNLASGIIPGSLVHSFNNNLKNRIIMINKNKSGKIAALKTLFFIPAVLTLLLVFSFRSIPGGQDTKTSQALFSTESQKQITELIYKNIMYPSTAREQNLTGRFFVIVKMKKGGKIESITTNDSDNSINVPLLTFNEVVVMGYGLKSPGGVKTGNSDITLLKNEGARVAKMLETIKVPEWEKKDMEFAISFSFQLNYPEEKKNVLKIVDSSTKVSPEVIIILDGKEISMTEMNKISPDQISTMSVLKDESATKVYGERGKNGVIILTTKK